jgi:hypothetical protein
MFVKIGQRVRSAFQHLARFGRREWPVPENLGQASVGALRDKVEQRSALDLAVAEIKNANQSRVGDARSLRPCFKLALPILAVELNELDGSGLRFFTIDGREDGGVVAGPEPSLQGIRIGDMSFQLSPEFGCGSFNIWIQSSAPFGKNIRASRQVH